MKNVIGGSNLSLNLNNFYNTSFQMKKRKLCFFGILLRCSCIYIARDDRHFRIIQCQPMYIAQQLLLVQMNDKVSLVLKKKYFPDSIHKQREPINHGQLWSGGFCQYQIQTFTRPFSQVILIILFVHKVLIKDWFRTTENQSPPHAAQRSIGNLLHFFKLQQLSIKLINVLSVLRKC